jgi:mannose-6-phosphate isomerase-like protein (cupin superfamily)
MSMPAPSFVLLPPGQGERLRFLDDSELVIKAAGAASEGSVAHYEYIAQPAAKGSPQHIHAGHDETFTVVEGVFEFALGEELLSAGPGTFLLVKRGQPHGFRNCGAGRGRIVGTFDTRFAPYFRELAAIIERTGTPPNPHDWAALYGRYETTFYTPR